MRELTYKEFSLPTAGACISSVRAAMKLFSDLGKKGFVTLERIKVGKSGVEQIAWVSRDQGRLQGVLPLFGDNLLFDPFFPEYVLTFEKIRKGELICRGDSFYNIFMNGKGEIEIRTIVIFDNEKIVRKACALKGLDVRNISLIRMFDVKTNEPLTGAWFVECADGTLTLIYVDLRDREYLGEIEFTYATLREYQKFSANNVEYTVMNNSVSGWHLEKEIEVYSTAR